MVGALQYVTFKKKLKRNLKCYDNTSAMHMHGHWKHLEEVGKFIGGLIPADEKVLLRECIECLRLLVEVDASFLLKWVTLLKPADSRLGQ